MYGARVSLLVGFVSAGIACVVGALLGAVAGYFGRMVDVVIMRFVDMMLCFPSFFLILAVIAYLDASIWNIMVVIGVTSWMGVCRLVRAEFLSLKKREFMVAAEGLGARPWTHHRPPRLAQRDGAGVGVIHPRSGGGDLDRERFELPGNRRAAARPELGQHAHRGQGDHRGSLVAVGLSRAARFSLPCSATIFSAKGCATSSIHGCGTADAWHTYSNWRPSYRLRHRRGRGTRRRRDLLPCRRRGDGRYRRGVGLWEERHRALYPSTGAVPPGRIAHGRILFDGRDLLTLSEREMRSVRGDDIAMIFQEPMTSLNPVFTVGDQVAEAIRLHRRVSKREAWAQAVRMLEEVEITDAAHEPRTTLIS